MRRRSRAADAERLREDLRLLYVALTRAAPRTCGWAWPRCSVGNSTACLWHRSALGYLCRGPSGTPEAVPTCRRWPLEVARRDRAGRPFAEPKA
jgi:hypothetical protein